VRAAGLIVTAEDETEGGFDDRRLLVLESIDKQHGDKAGIGFVGTDGFGDERGDAGVGVLDEWPEQVAA
jgi:hypothetical protein